MHPGFEYENRREYRRRLDKDTMELDTVATRLKGAFPVETELDGEVDRRILAKVDEKRSPSPHASRQWGRTWRIAVVGGFTAALLGTALLTVGIRIPGLGPAIKTASDRENPAISSDLPVVGSFARLKTLLAEAGQAGGAQSLRNGAIAGGDKAHPLSAAAAPGVDSAGYSTTNVQVQGVDEADIVKTDGVNLYQVNNGRIVIARLYPSDEMKALSVIRYKTEEFTPLELFVDDKRLIVIGYGSRVTGTAPAPAPAPGMENRVAPPYENRESTVKIIAYDLSDKAKPAKIREAELDGGYVSSRKIGSVIYLVANKYIDLYRVQNETTDNGHLKPGYRDSAGKGGFNPIDYSEIRYFPKSAESNYLMVASLDFDQPEEQMRVSTYLGAGQNIYASSENLYVAATTFETGERTSTSAEPGLSSMLVAPAVGSTNLYRFALADGRLIYQAKGEVPGTLLNQFSMDEHKGNFRVATTKGDVWAEGEAAARNNVYVLNKEMTVTGRLENVAPGERIYSVRFMGDRAYMVTFKKVDPLFVIDLADPSSPKILGELKIPGYSEYLHPYDENHIIGFGKDAVEAPVSGQGPGSSTFAYYQGMKIAMFDVTDVKRPVEKFKTIIGDRGTESELLHNHKALLFDKARNLMAFPVTVVEVKNKPEYRTFTFQGAYVYNVSLDKGMELKGKITHQPDGAGQSFTEPRNNTKQIERILYIGDTLYTVSKGLVKANGLADLREKNSLALETK